MDSDAPHVTASSDSGFGLGGVAAVSAAAAAPKTRKKRPLPQLLESADRVCAAFLVIDGARSAETDIISQLHAKSVATPPPHDLGVVGVVFFRWHFFKLDALSTDVHALALRSAAKQHRKWAQVGGYLQYDAIEVHAFDCGLRPCHADDLEQIDMSCIKWCEDFETAFDGTTLDDLCAKHSAMQPSMGFVVSPELAELLVKDIVKPIEAHALSARLKPDRLQPNFPTAWQLKKLRATIIAEKPTAGPTVDAVPANPLEQKILLKLPHGANVNVNRKHGFIQRKYDPCLIYKAIKFGRHLRNLDKTGDALTDAIDYACKGDTKQLVENEMEEKPQKNALYRSRLKLDAVSMNLERRDFKLMYETDKDFIESAHIFADGSPVTGEEIQGMVLQLVFIVGVIRSIILPGVVLHSGGMSLVDKGIALLWGIHLVVGLDEGMLRWIFDKIVSVTTDQGVELGLLDLPDLIPAFVKRCRGASMDSLIGSVVPGSKLFRLAFRLTGWSHLWGNLMKMNSSCIEKWPEVLHYLRQLCKFWRNKTYRNAVITYLEQQPIPVVNIRKRLKSFKASLKKWRYETVYRVLHDNYELRDIVETYLVHVERIIQSSQDPALIVDIRTVAKWKEFWILIEVFLPNVTHRCEMSRRWGLVCSCCRQARHDSPKRAMCPRSSRRLGEARVHPIAILEAF